MLKDKLCLSELRYLITPFPCVSTKNIKWSRIFTPKKSFSTYILKYNVVEKEAAIFTKSTNRVDFPANWAILSSERKQSGTD